MTEVPVASAGPDRSVATRSTVTLSGTGSDPDGTVVRYAWSQTCGAPVVLRGADTATATFTAPSTSAVLSFRLTVSDDRGAIASDVVHIAVGNAAPSSGCGAFDVPPFADAGPDQLVAERSIVTLNGAGSSDRDGSIVSHAWTQIAGTPVLLTGADAANPTFTAPSASGPLAFRLTVTDDRGAVRSDTVSVAVDLLPIANAGPDQKVKPRAVVTLDGSASRDPDGPYVFSWWVQTSGIPVTLVGGSEPLKATFTAPNVIGDLEFVLAVADVQGISASDAVRVTVSRK
jgi:hypothetical protein